MEFWSSYPDSSTLGARGFSCGVSGVGHVSIVKNLWHPGYDSSFQCVNNKHRPEMSDISRPKHDPRGHAKGGRWLSMST